VISSVDMTILWRWFWIVDNSLSILDWDRLLHHGLGERAWLLFLTSLLAFGMYFSIMDWENVRGAPARVTLIHSHFIYLFVFVSPINLSRIGIGFSIMDWGNVRGASARVTWLNKYFAKLISLSWIGTGSSITDWEDVHVLRH